MYTVKSKHTNKNISLLKAALYLFNAISFSVFIKLGQKESQSRKKWVILGTNSSLKWLHNFFKDIKQQLAQNKQLAQKIKVGT